VQDQNYTCKTIMFIITLTEGSGYRHACGSWNLKTYSYATCDVTVTQKESAVGLVETN